MSDKSEENSEPITEAQVREAVADMIKNGLVEQIKHGKNKGKYQLTAQGRAWQRIRAAQRARDERSN